MITLVVPFFDNFDSLSRLKGSLMAQSQLPDEIYFVDDFSEEKLLSSHLRGLPGVHILRNHRNFGPAYSRNRAVQNSKGDILIFVDSDCILPPRWIERTSGCFENKNINIVAGEARVLAPEGFGYVVSLLGYPAGGSLGFEKMWHVSPSGNTEHISSCNFAIRRRTLLEHGLFFNEKFPFAGCEDVEFSKRCIEAGEKIFFFKDNFILHPPKKGFLNFLRWHFIRGRSMKYLQASGVSILPFIRLRLQTLIHGLRKSSCFSYKIMLVVLFLSQVIFQFSGNAFERFFSFFKLIISFWRFRAKNYPERI